MVVVDPSSILFLILLLTLAGFFSGSEAALFSLSRYQLNRLARSRRYRGRILKRLLSSPSKLIACLLLGETLARVSVCGYVMYWTGCNLGLTVLLSCLLLLLFAEVFPRAVAGRSGMGWSLSLALPLRWTCLILAPFRSAGFETARLFSRLFRVPIEPGGQGTIHGISKALRKDFMKSVLDEEEKRWITSFFEFRDARVREVMVPRIAMVSCSEETSLLEAKDMFRRTRHSRVPVYRDSKDYIVGVVYAKDLLACPSAEDPATSVGWIARRPLYVPANVSVLSAMRTMQKERMQMGLVLDEWGGVAGLVTMDDLLESLVGDILEEEGDSSSVIPLGDGRYRVDPRTSIRQVEEALSVELPAMNVSTLGGLIYVLGECVPSEGDVLAVGCLSVKVERLTGHRMASLLVEIRDMKAALRGEEAECSPS